MVIDHSEITSSLLLKKIRSGEVLFGGNKKLKIYGKLNCQSGKRMNRKNRVFFSSEQEALHHGYRPCGHCMNPQYQEWKKNQ